MRSWGGANSEGDRRVAVSLRRLVPGLADLGLPEELRRQSCTEGPYCFVGQGILTRVLFLIIPR